MNFDELKNQWDKEDTDKVMIPKINEIVKQAHTPIDIVRRNMKYEFFIQLFVVILFLFFPKWFNFSEKLTTIFVFFYTLLIAFTGYYFYKFYVFYKKSYNLTFDSRNNLLWFFYELKLNIELYKALTYIIFFIAISFSAIVVTEIKYKQGDLTVFDKIFQSGNTTNLYFISTLIITILISFLIAELTPNYYYGRYLKKIKKVLDQLD